MFIGQGTYAKVYKNDIYPFGMVAIKKYKKNEGIPPDMIREVGVLQKCESSHIIKILSIRDLSIVLPLSPYSLEIYLKKNNISLSSINYFLNDICKGIYYLHCHGIIHGDLKPSNLLIENEYTLKIIDMGFSKTSHLYNESNTHMIFSSWYRPPEIYLLKNYSWSADIWSIGCILAEMFTNSALFKSKINSELVKSQFNILGITPCYFHLFPDHVYKLYPTDNLKYITKSKTLYKILIGFLHPDPEFRMSLHEYFHIRKYEYANSKEVYLKYLYNYTHIQVLFNDTIIEIRKDLLLCLLAYNNTLLVNPNSYFRAVNIFDIYLKFLYDNKFPIKTRYLKIILACCYWISLKCDNYSNLKLASLIKFCDYKYFSSEFINTEIHILNSLNWNIIFPVFSDYISIYSHKFSFNYEQKKKYTQYMYICTLYPEFYLYNLSLLCLIAAYKTISSNDFRIIFDNLDLQKLDLQNLQQINIYLDYIFSHDLDFLK